MRAPASHLWYPLLKVAHTFCQSLNYVYNYSTHTFYARAYVRAHMQRAYAYACARAYAAAYVCSTVPGSVVHLAMPRPLVDIAVGHGPDGLDPYEEVLYT
jgi:hypothetical protein